MKRRKKGDERGSARDEWREAIVLIPLTYNDGTMVAKETLLAILEEIYVAFAGWTDEGVVRGAYRMQQTGAKQVEDHLKISIVLREAQLPDLERMIGTWCRTLGQEVMLLKVSAGTVKFIPPRDEGQRS